MKRSLLGLILVAALLIPGAASAAICTIDQVPAATMLLPYFEVDLGNPAGTNTLLSINNASATAILAHVVVWSDLSVPVLDFNIYLTGYDVQSINMRDIIVDGVIPRTASAGQDSGDTISPKGAFSQDINFASCSGQLPPANPALGASFRSSLQAALTGKAASHLNNLCAGIPYGDNIARGYLTVDTVNNCTLKFPGDTGYFAAGGTGDATNQNVLWGDWFMVNPGQNYAAGDAMVAIEASPGIGVNGVQGGYPAPGSPETTAAGQYTFYGRYVNWTAADNREPLATTFAVRYLNGGVFSGGTDLLVWRDSKVNQGTFTCPASAPSSGRPAWYPLGQDQIVIFDEQEHPTQNPPCTVSPCTQQQGPIPFPAETQRVRVGGATLPVPYNFGWLYLDLGVTVTAAGANPPENPNAAQAWVDAIHSAEGRFSVGLDATQLDSACNANQFLIGNGP